MSSSSTLSSRPPFFRSISNTSTTSKLSLKVQKNKPRLYIALYPRGGHPSSSFSHHANCDSYHWSLIIGPTTASRKDPNNVRYHIAHAGQQTEGVEWYYEEEDVCTSPVAQAVLIRVTVAKITDEDRVKGLLREVPIQKTDTAFNCLSWVKAGLFKLLEDGHCLKTYVKEEDWEAVEACARKYCKKKREQRRSIHPDGSRNEDMISTFNYWENREIYY